MKLEASDIKDSILPIDFYRHELPGATLNRSEWNDGGLCPFHNDNRPGSFRINLQSGAFICFSCGSKGGDIIAFTVAFYGISFIEALTRLSEEWGV